MLHCFQKILRKISETFKIKSHVSKVFVPNCCNYNKQFKTVLNYLKIYKHCLGCLKIYLFSGLFPRKTLTSTELKYKPSMF